MRQRTRAATAAMALANIAGLLLAGSPALAGPAIQLGPICDTQHTERTYTAGAVEWGSYISGSADHRASTEGSSLEYAETRNLRAQVAVHGDYSATASVVVLELNAGWGWQAELELAYQEMTKVNFVFAPGKLTHWRMASRCSTSTSGR